MYALGTNPAFKIPSLNGFYKIYVIVNVVNAEMPISLPASIYKRTI